MHSTHSYWINKADGIVHGINDLQRIITQRNKYVLSTCTWNDKLIIDKNEAVGLQLSRIKPYTFARVCETLLIGD